MSGSQYEREREENLRNNRLMMENLFGSLTPAADMRQKLQDLKTEETALLAENSGTNTTISKTGSNSNTIGTRYEPRRLINKPLTSKEVDALEAIDNAARRKREKSTRKTPAPPPTTTTTTRPTIRYVFDHVLISRRTSRVAAREATERMKNHIDVLSLRGIFRPALEGSPSSARARQLLHKMRQRQAELLETGLVSHCHLCANERHSAWIPCSKCEQRFHYSCLKKWFNIKIGEYDPKWKCPVCRQFCNCTECREKTWKRPNGKRGNSAVTRNGGVGGRSGLRSSARHEEESGDDVEEYVGRLGRGNGSSRRGQQQQQSRKRTRVVYKDDGDDEDENGMEPRRSTRNRPSREAAKMAQERLREVDSSSDDEDDIVAVANRPGEKKTKKVETRTESEDDEDDNGGGDGRSGSEGEVDESGEDLFESEDEE